MRNDYPTQQPPPFDEEDSKESIQLHPAGPLPPYRTFASSSQIVLDDLTTPAYSSRVNLMAGYNDKQNINIQGVLNGGGDSSRARDDRRLEGSSKPTVHYLADLSPASASAAGHNYPPPKLTESRASSVTGTDDERDEDDGEDYDWSAEEDMEDQETEFEKRMGVNLTKPKVWGIKRIFTFLFSSLIGSIFLAALLISPALLVHFLWYLPNPHTSHRRFVDHNILAWLIWAASNVLISWALAMIVDLVPAVGRFVVSAVWGHVSEGVKTRLELYDSVRDTFKPPLYAGSAWASWVVIFGHVFGLYDANEGSDRESEAAYTDRVQQVIEFLFFLVLLLCAQKMLSHAIAFAFHRTAYQDRIESVRKTLATIEALRNYSPKPSSGTSHKHSGGKLSGTGTPGLSSVFGFGFSSNGGEGAERRTPFDEKEHFRFLSGALKKAVPRGEEDEGEADVEDDTVKRQKDKGKQKQKRKSPTPPTDAINGNSNTISTSNSSTHLNLTVKSPSPSRPVTPSNLHPNAGKDSYRYPPSNRSRTPSRRNSNDGGESEEALVVTAAKVLKTAVLHDARNIKGKDSGMKGGLIWNVNSAHEAKRLAKSIYYRFKDRRRTYLIPSDFYPAFTTTEEAQAAFHVFDKDDNGDISRPEIKATLLRVYKERRFLSRSMRDVGVALKTLDHILLFFAFVILFFISLSVFGVQVGDSLTSMYTIGIAASFVFKNSASSAFDAIMFLFVTHPYDTGDRCFIDDENLVVKKMGLFATVFTRADGTETYYFNSQLFTKFITNVRRSDKMFENLTMQVAWRTPLEKLDLLEKYINEWLQTEENRWFETSISLTFQHIHYQRHLEITIAFGHNGTWQDWGLRCARKTAFHAAVQYYCLKLGIVASEAPIPIEFVGNNTYIPSMIMRGDPLSPGVESTLEPETGPIQEPNPLQKDHTTAAAAVQSFLGFTPPRRIQHSLTRARKSKSRRTALRSMGAGG